MICIIDENNLIVNIVNADFPRQNAERTYYPWNNLGEIYTSTEPFAHMQQRLVDELGTEFARRRDDVRWINLPSGNRYGFDCAVEDISNFMAAYTPLLIAGSGETGYFINKTPCRLKDVLELFMDTGIGKDRL